MSSVPDAQPKPTAVPGIIRPLRRITDGVWRSRDGRWAFHRHFSDPHPQRWYAYLDDGEEPLNDGQGHTTLREVTEWADGLLLPPLDKPVASLPTAADVLREHRWSAAIGGCYPPCIWHGDDAEDEQTRHAHHQADMLAAAGLLATPEHDAALAALTRFGELVTKFANSPAAATFDRWLAEHDAQVAARALREAADDPEIRDGNRPWVEWFLTDRAARIEAGEPT